MIGLDTNVLVRYLTQDDPRQSTRAAQLIEQRLNEADPGFISVVAIVETVWVLERAYGYSGMEIAQVVERLLQANEFVVDLETEVFTATQALKEGSGSFSDALIRALDQRAGCPITVTFDQRALRLPGFVPV